MIMKNFVKAFICLAALMNIKIAFATPNQTDTVNTVISQSGLPFSVVISLANFRLPVGYHSGAFGTYKGLWVILAGRINGLHGFDPTNNFPPDKQNTNVYVIDPNKGIVYTRSLTDPSSGLTQAQIETLTVTSPESFQQGDTLFMAGGYGVDTANATFSTKPILTAINLPGIITWVMTGKGSVAKNIRQLTNPIFQITGGAMYRLGNMTQLVFGQNFAGQYTDTSNGDYSQQVRQFKINDNGTKLSVDIYNSMPGAPNPNFRRRDLTVLPTLLNNNQTLQFGLIAFAGVFTVDSGVWTVPVTINGVNDPVMADPNLPTSFKQAMNQYVTASASLYSRATSSMYHIFFGGASYGYFDNGTFTTDDEIPFINQVTTVQMDQNGNFTQYLMDNQYPTIVSTGSNPGNTLLFGAGARFIESIIPTYPNKVINLDGITKPTVIGHIIGGIMSTLPNTNTQSDSAASPYVFTVTLVPRTKMPTKQDFSPVALAHVEEPKPQGLKFVAHVE